MLHARGDPSRLEPTGEGKRERRRSEVSAAERASRGVENGRQVDVDARASQRAAGQPPGRKRLARAPIGRRPGDWRPRNSSHVASLLIDEDERSPRPRTPSGRLLDEDAGRAGRCREPGHDDEGRLLRRRQPPDRVRGRPAEAESGEQGLSESCKQRAVD
jgi:hypothetical protein